MPAKQKSRRPGARGGAVTTAAQNPSGHHIVMRPLGTLRPNPKSARTHSKRQIRDLAKAIKTFGFIGAIIIDETGMIPPDTRGTPRRSWRG